MKAFLPSSILRLLDIPPHALAPLPGPSQLEIRPPIRAGDRAKLWETFAGDSRYCARRSGGLFHLVLIHASECLSGSKMARARSLKDSRPLKNFGATLLTNFPCYPSRARASCANGMLWESSRESLSTSSSSSRRPTYWKPRLLSKTSSVPVIVDEGPFSSR
eukprot:scaffold83281_cov36-Tisochrysis_lutea.AAC.3